MSSDWLNDFVNCYSHGESPPRILYWVGVSTIAGALGCRVWIDEGLFKWLPNFYILIVGPPGEIKKSTSTNLGMLLLREVGADMGPEISTWQALITHMSTNQRLTIVGTEQKMASCVTLELSEFGSFFDTADHWLVDILVRLWDNKPTPLEKETKKDGVEYIENPWLNILACTTPKWIAKNVTEDVIGGGFGSRLIFIHEDIAAQDVSYPSRVKRKFNPYIQQADLTSRLSDMTHLTGPYRMTEAAYAWGDAWYKENRKRMRASRNETEANFFAREQTQLHKLAMVISVSRGEFPVISEQVMVEAYERLKDLSKDAQRVLGVVGQTNITRVASDILATLAKTGPLPRKELYRRAFFRSMSIREYSEALGSASGAGFLTIGQGENGVVELVKGTL